MKSSAIIFWTTWCLLPMLWTWLQLPYRTELTLPYDAISEFGACGVVFGWARRQARRGRPSRRAIYLAIAVALLGIGDGLFIFCFKETCPVHINVAAECTLSMSFALFALWLAKSMKPRQALPESAGRWAIVTIFTLASAILQYHYILVPLEASDPPFAGLLRFNYVLYSFVTALVFGLCCYLSLAAQNLRHILFLTGLLLPSSIEPNIEL